MIGLAGLTFTPAAIGENKTIAVTMDPAETAAIDLNVTNWEVGGLNTTASLDVQINNTGSVGVTVTTNASTITEEGDWSAAAGDISGYTNLYEGIGHDTYVIAVNGTAPYENIAGSTYTINTSVPPSGESGNTTSVTYSICTPETTSTNTAQNFNINITATAN